MTARLRKALTGAAVGFGMIGATILATSSPASAAKPLVVVNETVEDEFVVSAEDFVCGVEAHFQETVKVRVTVYFDKNGDVLREVAHLNGTTRVTTENGTAIDRWSQKDVFDPATGIVTTTGNPYNIHVPGSGTGVLVNDSGRLTFDTETGEVLFVAGPHPVFLEGPAAFEEVCALGAG